MLSSNTTPLPPSVNSTAIVYSNGIDPSNFFYGSVTFGNDITVTGIVIIVLLVLICGIFTAVSQFTQTVFPPSFINHFYSQVAIYIIRLRSSKRNNIFSLNVIHENGVYVSTTENKCPSVHEKHPSGYKSSFLTPDIVTNARNLSEKSKSLILLLHHPYECV